MVYPDLPILYLFSNAHISGNSLYTYSQYFYGIHDFVRTISSEVLFKRWDLINLEMDLKK